MQAGELETSMNVGGLSTHILKQADRSGSFHVVAGTVLLRMFEPAREYPLKSGAIIYVYCYVREKA
jgi:hypothetical protein